jgi:small subunit ribosomal protein S9
MSEETTPLEETETQVQAGPPPSEASATGRRKEAVARVMLRPGEGKVVANGQVGLDYFRRDTLIALLTEPLTHTERLDRYNVEIRAGGGGLSGQAGAARLGIARALCLVEPELRMILRKTGFLTRDARKVERKKYGQPKARKQFQFSKR